MSGLLLDFFFFFSPETEVKKMTVPIIHVDFPPPYYIIEKKKNIFFSSLRFVEVKKSQLVS